ncbi:cysteine--tRNA ligase [symbiont of Argiope bruennichi]|uniref:cysteine--tRNA ligase n=1 Tax=symbiont of Argiope bruennichi TaxID=2810479 RepID=UPI003DA23EB0
MIKKTNLKIFCSLEKKITNIMIEDNTFTCYLCGPTVYNHIHIGNLRPILFHDLITKYFLYLNTKVIFVHNITDIDDKIVERAKILGTTEQEISKKYYYAYLNILKSFLIKRPTFLPKVTSNIKEIKIFIEKLVLKNACYFLKNDGVYFNVSNFKNYYFSLSKNKEEKLISKESNKQSPLDFSVWKLKSDGKTWVSKFGKGRPGWHTECVVLIQKFFQKTPISLHGGGIDLIFPHHENEIIQNLALNNNKLSRNWIHFGLINFNHQKMSKSKNNFWYAKDFLTKYDQKVLRFFYFEKNYKIPLNVSFERLDEIKDLFLTWQKIFNCLNFFDYFLKSKKIKVSSTDFFKEIISFFENNLNTAKIIDYLINLNKKIKKLLSLNQYENALSYFKDLKKTYIFLGFDFKSKKYFKNDIKLVLEWKFLLKEKKYKLADNIRKLLKEKDILLIF